MELLKQLEMRTLFMSDILYFVSLYIYLRMDLNKHRFRTTFSNDGIFVKERKKHNNYNNYQSTLNYQRMNVITTKFLFRTWYG